MVTSTLSGKSLLTLLDYTSAELALLLESAQKVKREVAAGLRQTRFSGMTLAMIFEKRSTRTRCAFETAFGEEAGYPVFLSRDDIHLGEKESLEDTARVLGRMFSAIQFRGFEQRTAEILAEYSRVPVYNGLTDEYHPTQALADLLTLKERFGDLEGVRLCYVGDGRNNVARSLLIAAAKTGLHLVFASPASLKPAEGLIQKVESELRANGGSVKHETDVLSAVDGVNAVYTDVWTSMGEEKKERERIEVLQPYRVTSEVMNVAADDAIFLHCLPAVKGLEVTAEVIDGPKSAAWDQAENRKHTIKALMLETLFLAHERDGKA